MLAASSSRFDQIVSMLNSQGWLRSPNAVLERLVARVLKDKVELARGILLHSCRDADAAGLGQTFEACRDVDTIAKEVAVVDDDVAHVDADAKLDPAIRRQRGVFLHQIRLKLGCATE